MIELGMTWKILPIVACHLPEVGMIELGMIELRMTTLHVGMIKLGMTPEWPQNILAIMACHLPTSKDNWVKDDPGRS